MERSLCRKAGEGGGGVPIRTTGEKALHSVYSVSSNLFIGKDSGISPMLWGQNCTRRTENGKLICLYANACLSVSESYQNY